MPPQLRESEHFGPLGVYCNKEFNGDVPGLANRASLQSSSESIAMQHVLPAAEMMPHSEGRLLGFGVGIPAVVFLLFKVYWFGIRDNWETDNYSAVAERCDAVFYSIQQANDEAAAQAFADLKRFVGQHSIKDEWLANRVEEVNSAFATVAERIEQVRRKDAARELEKRQRREAEAVAKRQQIRDENYRQELDGAGRPLHTPTSPQEMLDEYHRQGRFTGYSDGDELIRDWNRLKEAEEEIRSRGY